MVDILKAIIPVIVVLLIGMLLRKKTIISSEGITGLQAVVMNITLPVSLFANFYKTRLSVEDVVFPLTMFIAVVLGIAVGKILCKALKVSGNVLPYSIAGYEAGMLGFAFMTILTGNITKFAMLDIGQDLAIFTVYLASLKKQMGKKQTALETVKDMLRTPVLVGILSGLVIGTTGLGEIIGRTGVGEVIDTVCSFLSAPTSMIILLVIGYRMNFSEINLSKALKICSARMITQAVFAVIILLVFKIIGGKFTEELVTISVILMFILPPPFILPLYTEDIEQKEFLSSSISLYTLITIVAFFVMIVATSI